MPFSRLGKVLCGSGSFVCARRELLIILSSAPSCWTAWLRQYSLKVNDKDTATLSKYFAQSFTAQDKLYDSLSDFLTPNNT